MKATIAIVAVVCAVGTYPVFGQQNFSMYDRSYSGPVNVYGQPAFEPVPNSQRQGGQPQQARPGLVPSAVNRLGGIGGYLWGFMPAPIRGAASPYAVPPGSGHVNVNFVPGSP
ncbi:MAG: hypothetical protein WBG50_28450 [Desulfomonilaceae bacterium]